MPAPMRIFWPTPTCITTPKSKPHTSRVRAYNAYRCPMIYDANHRHHRHRHRIPTTTAQRPQHATPTLKRSETMSSRRCKMKGAGTSQALFLPSMVVLKVEHEPLQLHFAKQLAEKSTDRDHMRRHVAHLRCQHHLMKQK
mmetsp:Transcript_16676/g.46343  ORF Transcript_16676/g.46343 Transcript_16676/m.46343 type:complete len:140 (-) Transcript_16676:656-1075(-)